MKIIVSTHNSLYPILGGGGLRTLICAEEFKRRGHEVIIIAPTDGVCELSGIRVHWLHEPRKQRSPILSAIKFNIRLLRKFLPVAGTADLFFVRNAMAAATIPFLRLFYKFKFVLDLDDIHAEYLAAAERSVMETLLTPLILWFEYWIINSADSVTVVTRAMKDLLIKKGVQASKISVVYDAPEADKITSEKEPGCERTVIHLGSVDRQHGVKILISAIPRVAKSHPDAKFLIAGGGRELANVIRLSEKLGVRGRCVFTDFFPSGGTADYLKKARIGIIPRHGTLPNHIVTTLKLYEYWAAGIATIASRLDGIKEIAEDGKDIVFFEPDSARDLADKIIQLLEHPELTDKIAKGGLSTVKKYTLENTASLIVNAALKQIMPRESEDVSRKQ